MPHRRLRPYLWLNGVLLLLVVAVHAMPFILPNLHITSVQAGPNGDPVSYQVTSVDVQWSAYAFVTIPLLFIVPNAVLLAFRALFFRRHALARDDGSR